MDKDVKFAFGILIEMLYASLIELKYNAKHKIDRGKYEDANAIINKLRQVEIALESVKEVQKTWSNIYIIPEEEIDNYKDEEANDTGDLEDGDLDYTYLDDEFWGENEELDENQGCEKNVSGLNVETATKTHYKLTINDKVITMRLRNNNLELARFLARHGVIEGVDPEYAKAGDVPEELKLHNSPYFKMYNSKKVELVNI